MHFPGSSHLSENRKQCHWKTSILVCYLSPWGHRNSLPPGITQGCPSCENTSSQLAVSLSSAWDGQASLWRRLERVSRLWEGRVGSGRSRKARGNRSSLTIIRSSHRVEEDFPDPLTLRLGSERKRKHICTDPLWELPQGGARPFWPFATCGAMHTHMHS